jgi:hypothetical protein
MRTKPITYNRSPPVEPIRISAGIAGLRRLFFTYRPTELQLNRRQRIP